MRNVILQEFISLDGLASGPNGSTEFIPAALDGDDSFVWRQSRFLDAVDLLLLGRVTHQMFAEYWPNVTEGKEKEFADKLNATGRVVFSRTLDRAPWGKWNESRIVRTDPVQEVRSLKAQPGKDMVIWGSLTLARSLMAERLIDQYQLVALPVVLGKGTPLFGKEVEPFRLKRKESKAFARGAVLSTYEPS
ncbi:MAG TPA: dihydrofolate reductase family protein [Thermoanaerobaculia bacterium]|nr:dihydrofolate reductase family protein [Thermoanaerobaculia bacterium]